MFEAALTDIKKNDPALIAIDLSNQGITAKEIPSLIEALQSNTYLRKLDLSSNSLGDDGVKILADFLRLNCFLEELNLLNNQVTKEGLNALVNALKENDSLIKLELWSDSQMCLLERMMNGGNMLLGNRNLIHESSVNMNDLNDEVKASYQSICVRMLNIKKRNYHIEKEAHLSLLYLRTFLFCKEENLSIFCRLPQEIFMHVLSYVAPTLNRKQIESVFNYASDRDTLTQSDDSKYRFLFATVKNPAFKFIHSGKNFSRSLGK